MESQRPVKRPDRAGRPRGLGRRSRASRRVGQVLDHRRAQARDRGPRVDPVKMRSAGISAIEIQRAIISQNVTMPGGAIETGPQRLTFRVKGRILSVEGVGDVTIRNVDNHPILVRDVATVTDGPGGAETAALANGMAESVVARSASSRARTASPSSTRPRARMKELGAHCCPAARSSASSATTRRARARASTPCASTPILGAILASLVVLIFLGNFRSTIIAAPRDPDLDHRHLYGDVACAASRSTPSRSSRRSRWPSASRHRRRDRRAR